jgi:hypothetical protein
MISFYPVLLAGALSVVLSACDENSAKKLSYTQLEVIQVKGACHEDHTQQTDVYEGEITRSRNDETREVLTSGSVTSTRDISERVLEEVDHPTKYQPPFIVEFMDTQVDTNQPKLILHGVSVSDRGDDEQGYDTTCELTVVKRDKKLPSVSVPVDGEDQR